MEQVKLELKSPNQEEEEESEDESFVIDPAEEEEEEEDEEEEDEDDNSDNISRCFLISNVELEEDGEEAEEVAEDEDMDNAIYKQQTLRKNIDYNVESSPSTPTIEPLESSISLNMFIKLFNQLSEEQKLFVLDQINVDLKISFTLQFAHALHNISSQSSIHQKSTTHTQKTSQKKQTQQKIEEKEKKPKKTKQQTKKITKKTKTSTQNKNQEDHEIEKGNCQYIFKRGPKKGELCNKNANELVGDKFSCTQHKSLLEKDQKREFKKKEKQKTKVKAKENAQEKAQEKAKLKEKSKEDIILSKRVHLCENKFSDSSCSLCKSAEIGDLRVVPYAHRETRTHGDKSGFLKSFVFSSVSAWKVVFISMNTAFDRWDDRFKALELLKEYFNEANLVRFTPLPSGKLIYQLVCDPMRNHLPLIDNTLYDLKSPRERAPTSADNNAGAPPHQNSQENLLHNNDIPSNNSSVHVNDNNIIINKNVVASSSQNNNVDVCNEQKLSKTNELDDEEEEIGEDDEHEKEEKEREDDYHQSQNENNGMDSNTTSSNIAPGLMRIKAEFDNQNSHEKSIPDVSISTDTEITEDTEHDKQNSMQQPTFSKNEQKQKIKEIFQSHPKQEGEKWNLISLYWFSKWQEYVGFDISSIENKSASLLSEFPGSIENYYLLSNSNSSTDKIERKSSYPKLKKGLENHNDFIIIPPDAWDFLVNIYGGGPSIKRPLIPVTIDDCPQLDVELYPIQVKVIVNNNLSVVHGPWEFSERTSIQSLIDFCLAQKLAPSDDFSSGIQCKLFRYFQEEKKEEYEDHSSTLQEAGIHDGCTVFLEISCEKKES